MKRFTQIVALAAALVAVGLSAVPVAQAAGVCVDSVTAGGWIPEPDGFSNFGLNAENSDGTLTGQLNYVNADATCHVVGFEVISYAADGDCRTIVYAVTVNDEPGFTATVTVCDNGEGVNADPDFFSISVADEGGTILENCSASGDLSGGDVQVHPDHGNCLQD